METRSRIRAIKETTLSALFVGAICLPLLGMTLRLGLMTEQQENRRLAAFPGIELSAGSLAAFPGKFKNYFDDNFGFRGALVRWQAKVKVNWLGVSSSPQVILGKEGWLFYADEFSTDGRRSIPLFTKGQLEQWRMTLEARRDWLAARGIRYLFTIAPHKQTVYPERLPDSFAQLVKETRLRQLTSYLKEHSDLEFLDLVPAMYEAKSRHVLYPKTDSHWNFYGGFTAYRAIIKELSKSFQGLQPVAESDLEVGAEKGVSGDLAKFLGLDGSITEERPIIGLRKPSYLITRMKWFGDGAAVEKPPPSPERLQYQLLPNKVVFIATERKGTSLPRAVIFHDSASVYLVPFLPENFSRAVMTWTPVMDLELIKTERPDVVVQEMGEMFLMSPPAADWPEIKALATEARRKASTGAKLAPPDYAGFHDAADCAQVYGWAWDKNNPDAVLDVEIYDGERLVATVPADSYREDLLKAGIGAGEHAFLFALPQELKDGRPHSISVRVAGSSFNLRNTPRTVVCKP